MMGIARLQLNAHYCVRKMLVRN